MMAQKPFPLNSISVIGRAIIGRAVIGRAGTALAAWLVIAACSGGESPTTPGDNGGGTVTPPPPPPSPNVDPTASFTTSVDFGTAPLQISFDASASSDSDGSIASYAWQFGGDATGSGRQTSHTYEAGGIFVVTLTVTDDRGGTAQASDTVFVGSPAGSGPNRVEGIIWFDRNSNGEQNAGEPGTERAIVYLDADADGVRDAGEVMVFTDENGAYRFEGLASNAVVRVTQELGFGWTNTTPGLGSEAAAAAVRQRAAQFAPEALGVSGPARIVGGDDADIANYPFQVALQRSGFQFCGGTIVNSRWVLTAAHCVEPPRVASEITVLAGTDNLRQGGVPVGVTAIRLHPDYGDGLEADVALLRLDEEVLIPRPFLQRPDQPEFSVPGMMARAIGWGQINTDGGDSDQMKETDLPVLSNAQCNQIIGEIYGVIGPRNICAGASDLGRGVCFGDSGGPLMMDSDLGWVQIGISSFLVPRSVCGSQPQAFARVSALLDYIVSIGGIESSGYYEFDLTEVSDPVANFGNFH